MKKDYQLRRYREGELGDAKYTLKSKLLFGDGSEMETVSVKSKTAKRKGGDTPTALKKQKQLAALREKNVS